MLLAYPRGRCAGRCAFREFLSWIFAQVFWTIMGFFSCTNGSFPQWLCKGHIYNCLPPGVTNTERLKEKLCDLGAPVGQEQILYSTSFIITLLHCPSLCPTGQKNYFWGCHHWIHMREFLSISANSHYKLRATTSMNSVAIQKCTVTKGTRTTCSCTDPLRRAGSE